MPFRKEVTHSNLVMVVEGISQQKHDIRALNISKVMMSLASMHDHNVMSMVQLMGVIT